ncbi:glycoside hydrolase [Fomitiporia mediterranea MF3/22]|uniref:glycoside hydrolase n=1 Tax=Fomitiporia mediterranea (strain MF3/22) TaxID=694068 RepID=UPI0004407EFB|nr:glycoside hydrolase [Fomitiporia mediterranea MF3/22]EJD05374.1 glycoside hydrolase [Fomitiporia mediterranea MF3/22]
MHPSTVGLLCILLTTVRAADFSVVVNGTPSHAIPETLFGVMFEDISQSGDGGIYAELLQNRAFQQVTPGSADSLNAWSAVNGAQIEVIDSTTPLSSALPNSLQVQIPSGSSGRVGVANSGYFGINVNESWTYNASVNFKFAEGSTFTGSLTASLVASDGSVLASSSQDVSGSSATDWTEFFVTLKPTTSARDTNNSFTITVDGESAAGETIFFSLFSLFPPTFKGRPNGIRIDLAETLADMKPAFFRFPGGNNLEGQTIDGRWIWNNTVGPLANRPGRLGDWGYINTDGLGLKEYLDFIEDMGMQSIMAVWAGFSFGGTVAEDDLAPYIQAAIDQINFVVGDPAKSDAAALRASLGHPEPYALKWVEIGNEDFFAADTYATYRWPDFVGNLSAAFPDIQFLATTDTFDPVLTPNSELYDIHVYQTPTWFYQNAFIYDGFERNGTKYFEGEYASISSNPNDIFGTPADGRFTFPVMSGSAGEAAFMTGLERNADIVFAASYAPVLQNINNFQWTPDLISFDAANVVRSTSYYVQQLFGLSKGTEYLPSTLPQNGGTVHWSITRDVDTSTVFIKVANAGSDSANVNFSLPFNVAQEATLTVLSGGQNDSNTPAAPNTVVPKTSNFNGRRDLTLTAPPFSLNVVKLTQQK